MDLNFNKHQVEPPAQPDAQNNSSVAGSVPSTSPSNESTPMSSLPQKGQTSGAQKSNHNLAYLFCAIAATLFLLAGIAGGFYAGSNYKQQQMDKTTAKIAKTDTMLTLPEGATITSQCSVGRGTQYILPKDIPYGPIYDSYGGKIIGVEYMIPKDSLPTVADKFIDYSLLGKTYDHIEIGVIPEGHAGFTMTHYHVDFFNVPKSVTSKITCDNTSPTPMPSDAMQMSSPTVKPSTTPSPSASVAPTVTAKPSTTPTATPKM